MRYQTVIITGASSGLGEEFAYQMAPDSKHLVLVARRESRLLALQKELLSLHPSLQVTLEVVDLNDPAQISPLVERLRDQTYQPDVLVNNAGMGDLGSLEKASWSKLQDMLQLNMLVLTQLSHAVVAGMQQRKAGYILNVSSMASALPIPDFAAYAASKAYVTSFSEAIRMEVKEQNVAVTALCPGPVHTEFGAVANRDPEKSRVPVPDWAVVSAEQCVKEGLAGMLKNKALVYPGWKIKMSTNFIKCLPMPILRLMMGRRPRKID